MQKSSQGSGTDQFSQLLIKSALLEYSKAKAQTTETTVVLFLLREIYAGFAGQTHTRTRDNVFLYLESLLCSQTDFNFQIFNLPQLLLYFSHLPHVKLPIYLNLNPQLNPAKY